MAKPLTLCQQHPGQCMGDPACGDRLCPGHPVNTLPKGPTQEQVRELLAYDQITGQFTWRVSPTGCVKAGSIAGTRDKNGYVRVKIDERKYRAHRLAWLYMTGAWPKGHIDHINGVRDDNRWENLRDVPPEVNAQNHRLASRHNSNGLLGVSRHPSGFVASIKAQGKYVYLGLHRTAQAAHKAYLEAKRKLHPWGTL